MTKQSHPSLFTMTTGFIFCNSDCKPTSVVRNWHRQLVLSRDHFSNYSKQHDENTLFLQTAFSPADMCIYQYNCTNNGKGLTIGTKEADTDRI